MKSKFYLYLIFIFLFLISFRGVFWADGYIGHTWDWGYPLYPSQIKKYAESIMFYIWNDTIDLGISSHVSKSLFLFGLFNYVLHFLGGIILQRIILFLIFFLSVYTFNRLARFLSFNRYASIVTSIFYAFSPLVYSRIIAGHLVYLIAYSIFPLFVLILIKYFLNAAYNNKKEYIYFGLIMVILSWHISFPILASIMVLLTIALNLLLGSSIKIITKKFFYAAVMAILLNAFWIVSFVIPLLSGGEIPRGGGFSANFGKISYDTEMAMRSNYLKSASQPISNIIRGMADNGLHTEFVFPINDFISRVGFASSFFIPIMVFSTLLTVKRKDKNFWFFMILAILGITLSSGVKNPFGYIIYEYVLKHISLLYSAFSNPMRFMPLVYISYAALIGYFIESVSIGKQDGKYKIKPARIHQTYKILPFLTVALVIYPFWSGGVTKPLNLMFDQPISLIVTKPQNEEKRVYEFLEKQKNIRVSYLPPAYNSFVGETDLNFEWSASFSPIPEFMSDMNIKEPLSKYIQTLMVYDNQDIPVKHLGKVFGLAGSKYIILPEYKDGILPYARFKGRLYIDKDLKRSLMSQEDIVKDNSAGEFGEISIYKNQNVLPLIYGAANAKVFTGNLEDLRRYFETSEENNREAYFFLSQIPDYQRRHFIKNASGMDLEIIDTNNSLLFLLTSKEYLNPLFNYVVVGSGSGWAPLANNWSKDVNYAALLDKEWGIYSERSSKPPRLSIEYRIKEAGRYILYGLFYFHPAGGNVQINIDGVSKFVVATRDSSISYRYIPLGQADLEERLYKIDIIGEPDAENVILALGVIPDYILSSTNAELKEIINDYRFKLVLR
jgi:hypothetical protein